MTKIHPENATETPVLVAHLELVPSSFSVRPEERGEFCESILVRIPHTESLYL